MKNIEIWKYIEYKPKIWKIWKIWEHENMKNIKKYEKDEKKDSMKNIFFFNFIAIV